MKSFRRGGKLIIEISEDALCNGIHQLPGCDTAMIEDRDTFLDYCAKHICDVGDTGDFNSASSLVRLIDELVNEAIEEGAGIEI